MHDNNKSSLDIFPRPRFLDLKTFLRRCMYVKKNSSKQGLPFFYERKIEVAEVKRKGTQIVCTKLSQTVTKGRSFFHCKTEKNS